MMTLACAALLEMENLSVLVPAHAAPDKLFYANGCVDQQENVRS